MSKCDKRIKAQVLREKGFPINQIAKVLKVSKGSVSIWCRNVILSEELKDKIRIEHYKKTQKGRLIGAQMNKEKRLQAIKDANIFGHININKIKERELLLIVTALYWSEGSKSERSSGFQFINSDPNMIICIKKFLTIYMGISKENLVCSVQINEVHKSRISIVLNFWKNLLELEDQQIRKPYFVKTKIKKVYENHDNYYGICRLMVRRSTNLKYRMLGLISTMKDNILLV